MELEIIPALKFWLVCWLCDISIEEEDAVDVQVGLRGTTVDSWSRGLRTRAAFVTLCVSARGRTGFMNEKKSSAQCTGV